MNGEITKEQAMEVFDGIMLGDAGLNRDGKYAQMKTSKSGIQYMPYLTHLRDVLSLLEVKFCTGHPKSFEAISSKGKPYTYCYLESTTSLFLLEQYNRWYPGKKRAIPSDVRVTSISLAYFFSDDGCTSWRKDRNRVILTLATHNFTKEDVYFLRDVIDTRHGICFLPHTSNRSRPHQIELKLCKMDEINHFIDLVEPYVHPAYTYKMKRPRTAEQQHLERIQLIEANTQKELKSLGALRSRVGK